MRTVFFEHALLPSGWARDLLVTIKGGLIETVTANATPVTPDYRGVIAMPGLASLHSHTFQRGMAGLAETRGPTSDSFWSWRQVMYRFLGALDPEDVEAIAAFAFMEMLEGGFTSVGEFHYLHHDRDGRPYANLAELSQRIAAAAAVSGIGLTLLPVFYAHGGFGGQPPVEGQRRFVSDLDGFSRLMDGARAAIRDLPAARLGIAPHSLRAATPEELAALLAAYPDGPVHIHIAEQMKEVEDCIAWSGQRPVEWLMNAMPVDHRWCLIHATHMTGAEVKSVAHSGAIAGLCPITEANLGDGIFDAPTFLDAGGTFGVGTDSNVEITAPGELRMLEYSQRLGLRARNVISRGEGQSTGGELYRGALKGGAKALGRKEGAIAPGMAADFVVLDGNDAAMSGVKGEQWLDAYIFTPAQRMIDGVIVGGRLQVEGGRHVAHEAIAARFAVTMRRLTAL